MAPKPKRNLPLPALPESIGELGPKTKRTKELSAWLSEMLKREATGDERASEELLHVYNSVPSLWDNVKVLQGNADRSWLETLIPPDTGRGFTREGIRREMERLRSDVAGEMPSPLERLLVDRVVLCWLSATAADTQYAQKLAGGLSLRESEFFQKRCERANRQLLRAVQTLATVRRLLTPVVQVNVAEQQINVAR